MNCYKTRPYTYLYLRWLHVMDNLANTSSWMWVYITHPGAQSESVPRTATAAICCSWTLLCLGGNSWGKWHLTIACICLLSNIVVVLCMQSTGAESSYLIMKNDPRFWNKVWKIPKIMENVQNNTHVHCITIRNIWTWYKFCVLSEWYISKPICPWLKEDDSIEWGLWILCYLILAFMFFLFKYEVTIQKIFSY